MRTMALLTCTMTLLLAGCVERIISISSEPSGALVWLNDEEVGRTPLSVPFTFYGTYDVRMELAGYHPLWTSRKTETPWWDIPLLDLTVEAMGHRTVEQKWHFTLEPIGEVDPQALIQRGEALRDQANEPQAK